MDIRDSENPVLINAVELPGIAFGVAVRDNIAYVASMENGLQIIYIRDPKNPFFIRSTETPGHAIGIAVVEDIAYVADGGNVEINAGSYSGMSVISVPVEIVSGTAQNEKNMAVTIPAPSVEGCYTLQISDGSESYLAIDNHGSVYVTDRENHRVQKFAPDGEFVTAFGELGSGPGQLTLPQGVCVGSDGRVYVSDHYSRIQVFKKTIWTGGKAIIVAGRISENDHLWNATQMSANFAYRTLTYQGFTKETIFCLSPDIQLNLDSNGKADDVDRITTNDNLEYAITTWAKDADALTLYIVDHGGNETFQMSDGETLSASELAAWLNQADISGKVTVVYDACYSGTFMQPFDDSHDGLVSQLFPDAHVPDGAADQLKEDMVLTRHCLRTSLHMPRQSLCRDRISLAMDALISPGTDADEGPSSENRQVAQHDLPAVTIRLGKDGKPQAGSLEISASMIETETSHEVTLQDVYGEDIDETVVDELCQGLVVKLRDALPLVEGKVVHAGRKKVTINLRKDHEIKPGMHLIFFREGEILQDPVFFREGEILRDPDTREILGANTETLGTARVNEVLGRNMVVSLNYQKLYDFNRDWRFSLSTDSEGLSANQAFEYQQEGNLSALGIAYCIQITPRFSVGCTLNIWDDDLGRNEWRQEISQKDAGRDDGKAFLRESRNLHTYRFSGINANFGALWHVTDKLALSAVLKTPFEADLKHDHVFHHALQYPDLPEYGATTSNSFQIDETLEMPMSYGMGAAYKFSKTLTAALDIYRTEWDDLVQTDGKETSPRHWREM